MNEARRHRKKAYLIKYNLYIESKLYHPDQNNNEACKDRQENATLKSLCWNINGGFSSKVNDLNFHMFLFSYDLIILTECWIEKITIVALMQEGQENSKSA